MSISFNDGKFFLTENGQREELTETYLLGAGKKKIHLIKQSNVVKGHKDDFNTLLKKVESLKKERILNQSFSKALDIYETGHLRGKEIGKYIPILFMGKIVVCKTAIEALFLRIFGGKKDCVRDLFKKYVTSKTFEEGRLKVLEQQKPIEAAIARIKSDIKVVTLFNANGEDDRFNNALEKLNKKLDKLNSEKNTLSTVSEAKNTAFGFSVQQTDYDDDDDDSSSIDSFKSSRSSRIPSEIEDDSESDNDGDIKTNSSIVEDDDDFDIFGPPDEDE
jgi:hypothetical protein